MEEIERTVIELEQRGKSNTHRIDDLEEQSKLLNELVTSVKLLAQNMQVMAEEQKKQGARLDALEKQPAENWNGIKKAIVTALVSVLVGGIGGALLALIVK